MTKLSTKQFSRLLSNGPYKIHRLTKKNSIFQCLVKGGAITSGGTPTSLHRFIQNLYLLLSVDKKGFALHSVNDEWVN
jgi:hypothetical protein